MQEYNGNQNDLEYLIELAAGRVTTERRDKHNQKRLARVERAIKTRPFYAPLVFELKAASQVSSYSQITPQEPYDYIVTGIISDNTDYDVSVKFPNNDLPLVIASERRNVLLNLSDIAGGTAQTQNGAKKAFHFPAPVLVRAGDRIEIELFKTATTDADEIKTIVLIGFRVMKKAGLSDTESADVRAAIARRVNRRTIFLKQEITFDKDGIGGRAREVYTPQCDEPLLLRGVRSTFNFSLVTLNIEGESKYTTRACPIWAIAQRENAPDDNYLWFERPIFLPARAVVEMEFENSVDGVYFDDPKGLLTWVADLL